MLALAVLLHMLSHLASGSLIVYCVFGMRWGLKDGTWQVHVRDADDSLQCVPFSATRSPFIPHPLHARTHLLLAPALADPSVPLTTTDDCELVEQHVHHR